MPKKENTAKTQTDTAFKNWISDKTFALIGDEIARVHGSFDRKSFVSSARRLAPLELKDRVKLIASELKKHLPQNETAAISILVQSTKRQKLKGFVLWPYTQFIQEHGLAIPDVSLEALKEITTMFTSEFAVRPFLAKNHEASLKFLMSCAASENVHHRRWASEGSRPRLPWGERLDVFIKNPKLTLPVLDALKFDPELYVRKSVANHLNDISKDHPALVVATLKGWLKEAKSSNNPDHQMRAQWITRHALRTLIKKGDPAALSLIGVSTETKISTRDVSLTKKNLKLGETLEFNFKLKSLSKKPQKIVVDYAIQFVKANGSLSKKVFKLKTFTMEPGQTYAVQKKHHLKAITTRSYHSGRHVLEIQVNGIPRSKVAWNFKV